MSAEVEQRQEHSHRSYGQTLILLSRLGADALTFFLGNVEVAETYHSRLNYQVCRDEPETVIEAVVIAYHRGEHAEADKVAERIYLYAEHLLIGSAVFHSTGYLAV